MIHLPAHIKALLLHHDCVILPGLGGFVTNYRPSVLHTQKQVLRAPGKSVAFNQSLSLNDGLLAHHIAQAHGWSYEEALDQLTRHCVEMRLDIYRGEKVRMEGVGILHFSAAGTIIFDPEAGENLLLESYGLEDLHVTRIKRSGEEQVMPADPKVIPVSRTGYRKFIRNTAAAAAIAAIAIGIYINREVILEKIQQDPISLHTQTAELFPFVDSYQYSRQLPVPAVIAPAEAPVSPDEDTVFIGSISVKKELRAEPTTTAASTGGRFALVAGVFRKEENAGNYLAELKNKGVNATLDKSSKGVYRVIIATYNDRNEAELQLKAAKNINKDSWILTL